LSLDATVVWPFACLFARASALMLSAPMMAHAVPVPVRVGFAAILAMGLAPVVGPKAGPPPADLFAMATVLGLNVLVGLLIGFTLQLVMHGLQMAGALLDMQAGLGAVQVLNPLTDSPVSLLAQFKYFLGVVLLMATDGHHMMLSAFVQSFSSPMPSLDGLLTGAVALVAQVSVLAIQIAAPVAGVCVVVDAASGLVNKSIPMMPVYLVTLPAKILVSIVSLGLALPILAAAMHSAIGGAFQVLERMLGG
jgi:flagellar biosynthetic protein FliR